MRRGSVDRARRGGFRRRTGRRPTGRPRTPRASTRSPASTVHPASRRQGLAVRPRGVVDGPLPAHYRTAGVPVRQPALRPAAQPGPGDHQAPRATRPAGRCGAGRARCSPTSPPPTGSPSITPRAACRAGCPTCRSCSPSSSARSPRSSRPSGTCRTWLGHDRHGANRDRGPGPGHRAVDDRGAGPPAAPDRAAVSLGRQRHQHRRLANDLAHLALDPNVHIQEVKALACDIRPGRRPRGPALRQVVRSYAERAVSPTTPARSCRDGGLMSLTPPAAPATATTRRGWASSPTRRSASAARPARWPARSGTRCQKTAEPVRDVVRRHRRLGASTWRHVAFIEQPARPETRRRACAG